ncbi:MAG: cbb3-type cytochrome c oxidase N-terminal domain-containing protein [Planctomycetota bacterium]
MTDATTDAIPDSGGVPTTGHVYDGIQEYDNPLPGWWTLLFYLTAIYAGGYLFVSWVRPEWTDSNLRYEAAMTKQLQKQFAELGELQPDSATIMTFLDDPELEKWLRLGGAIFQTNCVSCHGRDGAGVSGPNLTDDSYKLVKTIEDIASTITKGSVSAGMPAWNNRLLTNEIVLVSAYVASLRGQNLPGREAEGDVIPAWGAAN